MASPVIFAVCALLVFAVFKFDLPWQWASLILCMALVLAAVAVKSSQDAKQADISD